MVMTTATDDGKADNDVTSYAGEFLALGDGTGATDV